jgi:hypothetical protein
MPRLLLLACVAVTATTLAACSTVRLSYDNADWLLARIAARYVDLDGQQARAFKARLDDFHAWHRVQELPHYAALCEDAAERLQRGLTAADVDWAIAALRERGRVLGRQAAAGLAPTLASLQEAQLRQLARSFAEDNRKFHDQQLRGDHGAQARRRSEWLVDRFEDWLGPLREAQRSQVEALVAAFPELPELRLEERRRRQEAFIGLARQGRAGLPAAQAQLAALLTDPELGRAASTREAFARYEAAFARLLLDLDRSLTLEQRRNAVTRLRAYAVDFRVLAGAPVKTAGRPAALAAAVY